MTPVRLVRIALVALGFAAVFTLSQQATLTREGETVPGVRIAVGVLSVVFLVRAALAERVRPAEENLQKDLLWGLGSGGLLGIVAAGWVG
jgi:hypothetical protein